MNDLHTLPDHASAVHPMPFAGPDHPMRKITRRTAFGGEWTSERAHKVADLFDGLAAEWTAQRQTPERTAPVEDALDRGDLPLADEWLELGSGTGIATRLLVDRGACVVCTDISAEMLRQAPTIAPKFRADAARLPLPDNRFGAVLLVNMLLFPTEVDRVLRPDGALVWINTNGDQTPIHLPPEDVLRALPGEWRGTTARAGTGFWLVARRSEAG